MPSKGTGIRPKGSRNAPPPINTPPENDDNDKNSRNGSTEEDIRNIFQGGELKRPPMADFNSSFNNIDTEVLMQGTGEPRVIFRTRFFKSEEKQAGKRTPNREEKREEAWKTTN